MGGCVKCGAPLPLSRGRHRPRKFCLTCKPSRAKTVENGPVDAPAEVTVIHGGDIGLVDATTRKLRAVGKLAEPEGLVVVELAKAIVNGAHSGSSLAALSREYTRALAAACPQAGDVADDDGVQWGVG